MTLSCTVSKIFGLSKNLGAQRIIVPLDLPMHPNAAIFDLFQTFIWPHLIIIIIS